MPTCGKFDLQASSRLFPFLAAMAASCVCRVRGRTEAKQHAVIVREFCRFMPCPLPWTTLSPTSSQGTIYFKWLGGAASSTFGIPSAPENPSVTDLLQIHEAKQLEKGRTRKLRTRTYPHQASGLPEAGPKVRRFLLTRAANSKPVPTAQNPKQESFQLELTRVRRLWPTSLACLRRQCFSKARLSPRISVFGLQDFIPRGDGLYRPCRNSVGSENHLGGICFGLN